MLANPANWRIHPKAQQDALNDALDDIGWIQRIIVNQRTGHVIDGHLRIALAMRNNEPTVPVAYVDLDEREEALALATIDPIAAMAAADKEKLDELLRDVQTDSQAIQEMLAELAMASGIAVHKDSPWPDEDDYLQDERRAELLEKWQVKRGQVWRIGKHRVMCGDSLSEQDVALLIGEPVECIVTDPPYDMSAPQVRMALSLFSERAVVLAGTELAFTLAADGWRYCLDFVWHHRQPRSFPSKWQPVFYHNNIVMMARGKAKLGWKRPTTNFGSIIEIEGVEYIDTIMGHGKSELLFREMLQGFEWERWADPFLGTGASLLACEAQGKTLYGCELDPAILAVALERFAGAGMTPELLATH